MKPNTHLHSVPWSRARVVKLALSHQAFMASENLSTQHKALTMLTTADGFTRPLAMLLSWSAPTLRSLATINKHLSLDRSGFTHGSRRHYRPIRCSGLQTDWSALNFTQWRSCTGDAGNATAPKMHFIYLGNKNAYCDLTQYNEESICFPSSRTTWSTCGR